MSEWLEQEATNETVFRAMNEWTEETNNSQLSMDHRIGIYLCECSDRRCTEPISLTRLE